MRAGEIDARGQIAPSLVDRAGKRLLIHRDVAVTRHWRARDRSGDASAVDARTALIAGVAGPGLSDGVRAQVEIHDLITGSRASCPNIHTANRRGFNPTGKAADSRPLAYTRFRSGPGRRLARCR